MVVLNLKKMLIESVFNSNLTSINPENALFGWKTKKNAGSFIVMVCCAAGNYYIKTPKISLHLLRP